MQMMPNIIIQTLIYDVYVIIVNLDNLLWAHPWSKLILATNADIIPKKTTKYHSLVHNLMKYSDK